MILYPWTRIFAGLLLLSTAAQADEVALLNSPEDILRSKMELIENAKSEVLGADFIYRGDDFGLMKLAALIDARKRGALARQIVDAPHLMLPPALVRAAMDEGVEIRVFNPTRFLSPRRSMIRFHDKLTLSESEYQVGGTNTGNEYHGLETPDGLQLKDRDVRIRGGSAESAKEHFYEIWNSEWMRTPTVNVDSKDKVDAIRAAQRRRKKRLNAILKVVQKLGTPKSAKQLSNEIGEEVSQKEFQALERVQFKIELDSPDVGAGGEVEYITRAELDEAKEKIAKARQKWEELKSQRGWTTSKAWYDPADGDSKVTFLADRMGKDRKLPGGVADVELDAMRSAEKSILASTPYLVLTDKYGHKGVLKRDPSDKVTKTVLTNSYGTSDNKMTQGHYEMNLGETAGLGFDLHEYTGAATLHAKTTVIDDEVVIMGSVNKDPRSGLINTETAVKIENPKIAKKVTSMIEQDLESSVKVASGGKLLIRRDFCATSFGRLFLKMIENQL